MFCNKNHHLFLSNFATLDSSVDRLFARFDRLFASVDRLDSNDDSLDSSDDSLLFSISSKSFDVKYPLSFVNWLTLVGIDAVSALEFQLSLSFWVT